MKLKTISADLGISPSTVSKVLNGYKNFSISPELREKILAYAKKSGYTPNPLYQAMRQKDNRQISIHLPNLLHVSNGADISLGVDRCCEKLLDSGFRFYYLGYTIEYQKTYGLPPWKVAGALVVDVRREDLIEELDASEIPYVSLNGVSGPHGTAIMTDDYYNMMLLLKHLYELGHRKIGYLNFYRGPENPPFTLADHHYSVRQRLRAYQDFCREIGESPLPESLSCDYDTLPTLLAGLERGCTAFLSYSYSAIVEASFHLRERGFRIPEDISLATFNNPTMSNFTEPPLTCIAIPVREMGEAAAELLLNKYKDSSSGAGKTISFRGTLVQRRSTGPCRTK